MGTHRSDVGQTGATIRAAPRNSLRLPFASGPTLRESFITMAAFMVLASALLSTVAPLCNNASTVVAGVNLQDQVVVITGGDSGIGLANARALAQANASVVLAAYHLDHGQEVAKNISLQTGNPNVTALQVDLSNLTSVRSFCGALLATSKQVDVLINDAGISNPIGHGVPGITADGFERVFAVNYLGHFLMTELLLPALRLSPHGRVISVSSYAAKMGCELARRPLNCLSGGTQWNKDATTETKNVTSRRPQAIGPTNYGISKFMQIAHMHELSRRESAANSSVTAYSMHPGVTATSMTDGRLTNLTCAAICLADMHKAVDKCTLGVCPVFPAQAAATTAFIATGPGTSLVSGEYYFECAVEKKPSPLGWSWDRDPAALYDASLSWAGLGS